MIIFDYILGKIRLGDTSGGGGGSSTWGSITGTLSDQTDLQTALDGKVDDSITTNKLLGRYSTGVGVVQEITIGSGLTLTAGGDLQATGGSTVSSFCSIPIGTTDGTQTSANTVYAVKVVAPSSGTFTTLETYLNFGSGSENITLGVYNSSGTTLIASGSGLGATGVFSVTGLSIPLVAGTQYIFAIKADLGTSDFLKNTCFTNSFVASSIFAGGAGLPASIAGASASNVAPYICIK